MKAFLRKTLCVAVASGALLAQDPVQIRMEIDRMQRELQQAQSQGQDLLEARIRHDLGLPVTGELPVLRTEAGPSAAAPAIERAQLQLSQEESVTANLVGRYERLKSEVEALQREAQARAQAIKIDPEWQVVPTPQPVQHDPRSMAQSQSNPMQAPVQQPARPDGESAPAQQLVATLPSVKGHIDGSDDHGLVAQSLLRASQALIERADQLRAQGLGDAADQALDEAKDRLDRALVELGEIEVGKNPPFVHLFRLGRCRELRFRIAERRDGLDPKTKPQDYAKREQEVRDAYVAITARDVVRRGEVEVLGPWGRAAQAALDHFRWVNLHSGYAPKADPKSIHWANEKQ